MKFSGAADVECAENKFAGHVSVRIEAASLARHGCSGVNEWSSRPHLMIRCRWFLWRETVDPLAVVGFNLIGCFGRVLR